MEWYYDEHRVEGPSMKEGDKVYLLQRNLKTRQLSDKLDFKKVGPFTIQEKVAQSNFQLKLPKSMRLRTHVFYISLLEPAP
jgi:hypothetical protein